MSFEHESNWLFILPLIVIAVAVAFFMAGVGVGMSTEQSKAIKANVGRWTIDPKSSATKFVYGAENATP